MTGELVHRTFSGTGAEELLSWPWGYSWSTALISHLIWSFLRHSNAVTFRKSFRFASQLDSIFLEAINAAASASSSSSSSDGDSLVIRNEGELYNGNASKQLVLYDLVANGTVAIDSTPPGPIQRQPPRGPRFSLSRVLPSIRAFTIQCANCFKWRIMPTKENFEEIREHILEDPFVCETAHE